MARFLRWHPFLILGATTIIVPLVWRVAGVDYDNGLIGLAFFAVSYVLLWPAMFITGALRLIPPLADARWVFVASMALVLAVYVWIDRSLTRWWKSSERAA